jgi:hypothetical protein
MSTLANLIISLLTIWKAWAMKTAKMPTPRKMRRAAWRLTVGLTPWVIVAVLLASSTLSEHLAGSRESLWTIISVK